MQFLTEASPESMVRELFDRKKSALLLVFEPGEDDSYDLADVPDNKLKCIATEDINQARFAALVESFGKRFAREEARRTRRDRLRATSANRALGSAAVSDQLFELKGDRLGMSARRFQEALRSLYHRRPAGFADLFRSGLRRRPGRTCTARPGIATPESSMAASTTRRKTIRRRSPA